MILTCPSCASRYRIDEAKLGPQGRTVRCAGCGDSWRAEPLVEPLQLSPDVATPDAAQKLAAVGPELAQTPAEELPKVFRQKAEAQRRTREAVTAGAVWGAMSAGLAMLLLSAVVFRVQVVRLWPRTAGAYAAVHLTVNPLGLAPENVKAGPGLENGRAALIVTGAERNVDSQPRGPEPLIISIYDKAGARLLTRRVELPPSPLAGGESRSFRASFLDPPMAAAQVGVDFAPLAVEARAPRLRPATPPPPYQVLPSEPRLRGQMGPLKSMAAAFTALPPVTARSIPANSPFALPAAARAQTD